MWEDPIVADVHRTREMLAGKYGYDVQAIFADLRKRQAALGSRLVSPTKRAEPTAEVGEVRDFGSSGSTPLPVPPATEVNPQNCSGRRPGLLGPRPSLAAASDRTDRTDPSDLSRRPPGPVS